MEHVVLVDAAGIATATLPKATAHSRATPRHLAFSCYVVRPDGAVLLTRRATAKRTWPGVWSNACCGHPQLGETLREAVTRRLDEELGLAATTLALVLPAFSYRASMDDGTVEDEVCPVLVAGVDRAPDLNRDEVDGAEWTRWPDLVDRARRRPASLSPWSVMQIGALIAAGWEPHRPVPTHPHLDRRITLGAHWMQPGGFG